MRQYGTRLGVAKVTTWLAGPFLLKLQSLLQMGNAALATSPVYEMLISLKRYTRPHSYRVTLVGGEEIASLSVGHASRAFEMVATARKVTLPICAS